MDITGSCTSGCKIHSSSGLRQRLFTMFAYTHTTILIRKHEGKAHLRHDKQGMKIPYDNGRILFKRDAVSRGYATKGGNALTVSVTGMFINSVIIYIIMDKFQGQVWSV